MIERWGCCAKSWLRRGWAVGGESPRKAWLFVGLVFLLAACQEQIIHDLSEREANRVLSHLSVARLDARKVRQPDGRWAISVNREQAIHALSYIDTRRILANRDMNPMTSKGTMIPSREEQWFRYERSVAVSIEESLSALPGVLEARVHVNLPDGDPLFGDSVRKGGSGSVLLVVDRGFCADDEEIAALVSGAAGLSRDVVRVLKSAAVESSLPEVVETLEPVTQSRVGYGASGVLWPLAMVGIVVIVAGLRFRFLRRGAARKVRFELPKELEFEG